MSYFLYIKNHKNFFNILGAVLAVSGAGYVFFKIYAHRLSLEQVNLGLLGWIAIGLLVLTHAASNFFLSTSWHLILEASGIYLSKSITFKIFGLSQISRYLPGNIFHIAGRHLLGLSAGIPNLTLIKSSIFEIGFISLAGLTFSVLLIPVITDSEITKWSIFGFLLTIIFCYLIFLKFYNPKFSTAFLSYVVYLFLSGLLFLGLLYVVVNELNFDTSALIIVIAGYIFAWLIGLITPGAPAGVGIREAILIFMLKGYLLEVDILVAVLLGRAITVLGDCIFYLGSYFFDIKKD